MVERRVSTSQSRRRRLPVFARFFLPLFLLLPLFLAHDDRSERAGCCVKWWFFFILLCAVLFLHIPCVRVTTLTTLNTDYIISQTVVFQYPHLFIYLHTILKTQSHTSI